MFARWEEITAADAPWWTRPTGVGLRLRLAELSDLAEARSAGGIAKQAITRLIGETQRVLFSSGSYCARRYKAAVDDIRRSLREDAAETWVPEALGPSAIGAALELIDTAAYLPRLVDDLAADAAAVSALASPGEAAEAFTNLEALVELLDAELVHDGHSLAWRRRVLEDAKTLYREEQLELGEAIRRALADNRHALSRQFDVLVPVTALEDPPSGRVGIVGLDPTEAIRDIIRPWEAEGTEAALRHEQLAQAAAVIRYQPTAVDAHAAARETSRDFERDADLWRLRDGIVVPGEVAFIYDPLALRVDVITLPAEPLDLLPRTLGNYEARAGGSARETSTIDDALLQLAQARTAPPATALISLWTAAEALFAGAIGDVRGDAAPVMAALSELLYLRDLLAWLGDRYSAAGLAGTPEDGSSRWGLERTLEQTTKVLDRLAEQGDALAWWRLKTITRWDTGGALREQLGAFSERMEQVGARAYLIRNFALHRAQVRERALAVTLPPFAGVVRECVGYAANNATPGATLKAAKAAALDIRHVANKIELGDATAPEALWPLLPGATTAASPEPNVVPAEELGEALGDDPGEAAEPVRDAEPVPIEDVEPDQGDHAALSNNADADEAPESDSDT